VCVCVCVCVCVRVFVRICVCMHVLFLQVEVLRDKTTALEFKLNDGDMLFVDNRRCL